jgi:L-cysteine:1D-myo-inositol 2-amino-2-deoxy-alpha-D-glucopyranoside ligase
LPTLDPAHKELSKTVQLYNTQTRRKEPFTVQQDLVTIYVCGVTPYDTTHLGHGFTYVFFDTLVRYLRYRGYRTKYVQNVTDVDDDIMRKSREMGMSWDRLAEEQTLQYQEDMAALNVLPPDVFPRASWEVPKIIEIGQALQERGFAYQSNGNLYFDVHRYPPYGQLSHLSLDEMLPIANERGNDPDDPRKADPLDFVLWQESAPGEPRWDSPWGAGRPGWHIECSAMALRYLGETIDIHGGGADLIFPHHESEIAQSENATGQRPFVRFWVHTAMVRLDGEKMSKSLGNLVLIRQLLARYTPTAIRLLLLRHHHTQEWTYETGEMEVVAGLDRLIREALRGEAGRPRPDESEEGTRFIEAMENGLDTPEAVNVLLEIARRVGDGGTSREDSERRALLRHFSGVLGLRF